MKRTLIFLSMLVMVFSLQDTNAQSIRSIMRKKIIEDQLEAQAKRDSSRAVDAGEEPDQSPNTTMTHVYMDAMGLSGNVDYESIYKFDAYIQMDVSNYNKNEKLKDKVIYDSYYTKDAVNYAMVFHDNNDKSTIIFDSKNNAMLILTDSDDEHSGIAMGIDPEALAKRAEEFAEESGTNPYEANKTGRTKTILGYTCDEYLVKDEESEARMWASEKLGKQVRREMLTNQQTFGGAFYHAAYLKGMVLEYNYLDKDDGDRTIMQVTNIDLNHSQSISTNKYSVITMRSQSTEE